MRFVGFGQDNGRYIGSLIDCGRVRPLCAVDRFYADLPHWLAVAAAPSDDTLDVAGLTLEPAISPAARIFCVGLNYRAHAAESAMAVADHPTVFARWAASLAVGGAAVRALDAQLDWEAELAVIIGQPLAAATPEQGRAAVFGYASFNDISARSWQRHTTQWALGKNMDGSGPIGPVVTADETGDPEDGWPVRTWLNDRLVQDGNTRDMIYGIGAVASYISGLIALRPGDVIATGTPEGVGIGRKPPLFMAPGDRIAVEIGALGKVENPIVAADAGAAVAP